MRTLLKMEFFFHCLRSLVSGHPTYCINWLLWKSNRSVGIGLLKLSLRLTWHQERVSVAIFGYLIKHVITPAKIDPPVSGHSLDLSLVSAYGSNSCERTIRCWGRSRRTFQSVWLNCLLLTSDFHLPCRSQHRGGFSRFRRRETTDSHQMREKINHHPSRGQCSSSITQVVTFPTKKSLLLGTSGVNFFTLHNHNAANFPTERLLCDLCCCYVLPLCLDCPPCFHLSGWPSLKSPKGSE